MLILLLSVPVSMFLTGETELVLADLVWCAPARHVWAAGDGARYYAPCSEEHAIGVAVCFAEEAERVPADLAGGFPSDHLGAPREGAKDVSTTKPIRSQVPPILLFRKGAVEAPGVPLAPRRVTTGA